MYNAILNFFTAHWEFLYDLKPKAQSERWAPYYAIGNYVPKCQLLYEMAL
jgi:hypothetical protein